MSIDAEKTKPDIMDANKLLEGRLRIKNLHTYADIIAQPSLHSPLGPSSMDRWINCPGSVALTKDMPDTSSEYADEGTFAHHLSELCRVNNVAADKYIGLVSHCGRFNVDKGFANDVQYFLDYVNQFPGEMLVEEVVEYDAWVPGGFGTIDDNRISEGLCVLTDLKFGKGVKVYVKNNSQMWGYALGVFQTFGHLYDIIEFQLNICQPRLDHIDECTVPVEEILLWAQDTLKPASVVALGDDAPFMPGTWCRWCKAREICKPRAAWLKDQMLSELDDMESVIDPELMSNDELADAMDVIDLMRSWCNDIEARTLSEVQAGRKVGDPSWKMVAGRSSRIWRSAIAAEAALRLTKLKVNDIFKKTLITPPQAEKLLGKTHSIMVDHVKKPPGKAVLAHPSDPRPDIKADISELDDDDNDNDD